MTTASQFARRPSSRRIRQAAIVQIEHLESRAYLNGVVFGSPHNISAASAMIGPVFVNLDDVNGDGKADLIVANVASGGSVGNSVSVLLGNGDATFGAAQTIALPAAPLPLAEADVNGDGHLDIITGNANGTVSVILNNGSGTFGAATSYVTGLANAHAIALGDFNGDGRPDIATVGDDSSAVVSVLLNNGDGTFGAPTPFGVGHATLAAITAFTAGGHVDLGIVDQTDNRVTVMSGNGSGSFAASGDFGTGTAPVSITTADFNGDGHADLVTANSTNGNVTVLLGNGGGAFAQGINSTVAGTPSTGGPLKVRVSQVNGDAIPDLILLDGSGSTGDATVLLGNGDGTFHTGTIVSTGGAMRDAIAAGDLNNDGFTDLVVSDPSQVTALLNTTAQDNVAPTAAVDITQPIPTPGDTTLKFSVTYSDLTVGGAPGQIDATTISNGNLMVTDPTGNVQAATLVSMNLDNGPNVTAVYQINTPDGHASLADNGTYTVIANANSVKDANGNPLAAGMIGTFLETVPVPGNGPNLTAGPVVAKLPSAAIAGQRAKGTAKITITNTGLTTASATIVVNLYASPDSMIRGNAPQLATVTKKIKLKPHKRITISFGRFTWPANLDGTFFLVSKVDVTNTVIETNEADNVGVSAHAVTVAPPFIDVQNLWNGALPATTLVAGRRISISFSLKNNGNVPAKGTANVQVLASTGTVVSGGDQTLATVPVHVNIQPGKTNHYRVSFTVPSGITAGTYHMILVSTLAGDTNAANDAAASAGTFMI